MANKIPRLVADFQTQLSTAISVGSTSFSIASATDDSGVSLAAGLYCFTVDTGSKKEYLYGTLSGTSVTGVYTITKQGVASSGTAIKHRIGAIVRVTDFVTIKRIEETLRGALSLDGTAPLEYDSVPVLTPGSNQIATVDYVDDEIDGVIAGTYNKLRINATAGETLAAGNLVYLKASDGRWWLTDADTAATVDNVTLGIAQGSATAGNAVTILLYGVDTNQTGLTANTKYYASNTAGGISTSAGTVEVSIGISQSTTAILFTPRYDQGITEDTQDALAGTSGTPSSSNLFVTANDQTRNLGQVAYAASAAGTDTYAVTLSPAPTAYAAGMEVEFKADVANTGACTLNVNGLGAKNIYKNVTKDLVTGDILANQMVKVVYDGTNFQLQSSSSLLFPPPELTTLADIVVADLGAAPNFMTAFTHPTGAGASYYLNVLATREGVSGKPFREAYIVDPSTGRIKQLANGALVGQVTLTKWFGCQDSTYVWICGDVDGGGFVLYRYTGNTGGTTGEQLMTISGTSPDAATDNPIFTDGTFLYICDGGTPTQINKYSISGTTATFVESITFTGFIGTSGAWCDGTHVYQRISDTVINKWTLAGGSPSTTIASIAAYTGTICGGKGVFALAPCPGFLYEAAYNWIVTAVTPTAGIGITLYPVGKPL